MDPGSTLNGQRRRGGMRWWVLLLFAGYLGYYWVSHRQQTAFTGRAQWVDTTIEQEAAIGLLAYQQLIEQAPVVRDPARTDRVVGVARRLIAVAPRLEHYLATERGIAAITPWQSFAWDVAVIESEQANAFCLPGGKMAVYTGLLPITRNDDALAAVLGHEIAHAVLRHGAERMAQQKLVQVGSLAVGLSSIDLDPRQRRMLMAALGVGTQYGLTLPFSRKHESEADYVGLLLAAAACYDPSEAIGLWQRMDQHAAGRTPPEFMSTHPSSRTRIQRLQGWMDEANQVRAHFCGTDP